MNTGTFQIHKTYLDSRYIYFLKIVPSGKTYLDKNTIQGIQDTFKMFLKNVFFFMIFTKITDPF